MTTEEELLAEQIRRARERLRHPISADDEEEAEAQLEAASRRMGELHSLGTAGQSGLKASA